jgi:UDP-N-acetylglucosamine--N-acetylmuramyl-(pentapeptide) pyrophosphoryl-undecaprenol N-acetylglucosamine transferase
VFSKGGFVSFPVVVAAWLWRVPVIAHESDLSPGLANRLALPFVQTLCVSFPISRPARFSGRLVVSGSPIREDLLTGSVARGRGLAQARPDMPIVLIIGGSLGSDAINDVVFDALPKLVKRFNVVHICGPGKRSDVNLAGYQSFEYVTEGWGDLLAAADLIVSRAGANSLFETLALGKPNLLIPLSRKASRGDQIENAAWAAEKGYSRVLSEDELTVRSLLTEVGALADDLDAAHRRLADFDRPDTLALLYDALVTAGS